MTHYSKCLLRLMVMLLVSVSAEAEIYKQTDDSGRIIYSDNPKGSEAERVNLPPVNSQPAIKASPVAKTKNKDATPASYQITINTPADGSHIPTGQRQLQVTFSARPHLQREHSFQVLLNGQPHGPSSRANAILLSDLYRGEYKLSVAAVDDGGNIISSSDNILIYVQRAVKPAPAVKQPKK